MFKRWLQRAQLAYMRLPLLLWVTRLVVVLVLIRLWPHADIADRVGTSRAVFASDHSLLRLTLAPDDQYRLWTPLAHIAPTMVDAVLLYEDRYFYWHYGANPLALLRSAWHTATGDRRMGGSTLTMQLARRLYGMDSRTVGGKLYQTLAAVWIEMRFSKRAILEAYLNTVPYGSNIEGVGAASLIYFRKDAAKLTLPEALTLAVIPQNPIKRTAERGHNQELQTARERLWQLWSARDPSTARFSSEASLSLDTQGRSQLPFLAPHVTERLLTQFPRAREIDTTLDIRMQRVVERVTQQYLRERRTVGLMNASALLLDAQTMEVRAAMGSADFKDETIQGQVNGVLAKRSPGSTLKPFIYALALDQGLLHPKTVLKDAPTSFGPFTPENFDQRFAGPITAQDALIRSRNVPAVSIASKLSKPSLYDFMKLAGVSRLQSESHYGLALVLGGGEVTMEELATMYAVLANKGVLGTVRYVKAGVSQTDMSQTTASRDSLQLLSPEAAYMTLDMLRQTPRPDSARPAKPEVAWKTGTSWGFRDAWTAGLFGRYVLVVWVGNFDGSSNPALVGVDAAAPLFLRIVDALRAEGLEAAGQEVKLPANLRKIEVCAATGGLPDSLCPVTTQSWFIAGRSPIAQSNLHRNVWIDPATGKVVCPTTSSEQANKREVMVEDWGTDMQKLFAQSGLARKSNLHAGCGASAVSMDQSEGAAPVITSPLRGVQYVIRTSRLEPIALRADAAAGVQLLYWFAGDALIGKVKPGVGLTWLPRQSGSTVLRVVDDAGRSQSRGVEIEFAP